MSTFWNWSRRLIISNDVFMKQITFTYKGNDSMKSLYGGTVSLITKIIVFSFLIVSIVQIFNRDQVETATKIVVDDILDDETVHYVGQSGFAFAISYMDYGNNPTIIHNYLSDETYFDIRFFEVNRTRNYDNTHLLNHTQIRMDN